ncbi:HCP-like protein [Lentinula raphanica]|nr:HCP-like protein [Lentinula raphanica]
MLAGLHDHGGRGRRAVSPAPTVSQYLTYPPNPSPSSASSPNLSPNPSTTPAYPWIPPASDTLTAPLATIPSLQAALDNGVVGKGDVSVKVAWARDVLGLVDRASALVEVMGGNELGGGAVVIQDARLLELARTAIPMILDIAKSPSNPSTAPAIAEATYHRATLLASGAFPEFLQKNPRQAFRDFESAARSGYGKAWFRIGRDYEGFGDVVHARECFGRGVRVGEVGCLYRMGMAGVLGQLKAKDGEVEMEEGLRLLKRAAECATVETPQPPYVLALILLNEFTPLQSQSHPLNDKPTLVSLALKLSLIPPSHFHSPPQAQAHALTLEAKRLLLLSAYLHFSPAQYKLGHAYEFASDGFEFDALRSVEWYSRASQGGEVEADMALSKWFLCGSRGGFEKDEQLARIFAEKAARRGLASAEFAMGYYCEVGIGGEGRKEVDEAREWYRKAHAHGNPDASARLSALESSTPQLLSREEHDQITESRLVRTRTQAKQRSEAQMVKDGYLAQQQQGQGRGRRDSKQVVDLIRKNTLPSSRQQSIPPYAQQPPPHVPQQAPRPPPQGQQPQAYPTANRYTLVDPGSASASPRADSRSPSLGPPPPAGRPHPPRRGPSGGLPISGTGQGAGAGAGAQPPKPSGPQTFAEMGITGAKAEDEKCVIM